LVSYFGDKSIRGDRNRVSSHNAVCEANVTAWVLARDDIESVIGDIQRLGEYAKLRKSRTLKPIILNDLRKHRMLGQGAFGKVWLVTEVNHSQPYALKMMNKRQILDSQQEDAVVREKEFLAFLHHPFILHLITSYQDADHLYLLLPLISGGELFSLLHKRKTRGRGLSNTDAAFYAACVIEALGHFHQRSIAYRDLKLENVLVRTRICVNHSRRFCY
jgi:serine/threonine protein kinase